MRPIYERPIDLLHERQAIPVVLGQLATDYGLELTGNKLDRLNHIDYELFKGFEWDVRAYCEHKWRHPRNQHHETWFVSNDKIQDGFDRSERYGHPVFIAYTWGKEVWLARVKRSDIAFIAPGGRTDRGDPADVEMMAHFPRRLFRHIGNIL